MPVYQAVVLAVVQAFGEFLPISSSAHLILTRWFLGWSELDPAMDLTFDVALHAGTLLAVLIYFFPTWVNLIVAGFGGRPPLSARHSGFGNVDDVEAGHDRMLLWWIVLGTVPGAIAGKLLDKYAEIKFRDNYLLIGSMLVVVGPRPGGHHFLPSLSPHALTQSVRALSRGAGNCRDCIGISSLPRRLIEKRANADRRCSHNWWWNRWIEHCLPSHRGGMSQCTRHRA